jgi:hypothetical protein
MSLYPCEIGRERAIEARPCQTSRVVGALAVAVALGALCTGLPVAAALYKWTDANGRVVYSDQPPPGDVKVETIAGPPPPANPNAPKELANKEMELKKQQSTAADNAKKTAQQRADAEKVALACRDARVRLGSLAATQSPLYQLNEKGETVFMDDAERSRQRDDVQTFLRANCSKS